MPRAGHVAVNVPRQDASSLRVATAWAVHNRSRFHHHGAAWRRPDARARQRRRCLLLCPQFIGKTEQSPQKSRHFEVGNNFAVPALFLHSFPSWFVGIAFAAIGIGALVPAAVMSIAVANLYARNIHREFINRIPTDRQEAQTAKWTSLVVKLGALAFIIFVPTQYAIYLQLLGGIWIIQTLPSAATSARSAKAKMAPAAHCHRSNLY
jgi:hypothetical protein